MSAVLGSTTCQASRVFHSCETTPTRLRTSSASLFQSFPGGWRSLLIKTGARPLARNSKARLVATSSVSPGLFQNPESLFCSADQLLGAQAIPVVLAEETHAGEPPGPLQSVKVVELLLLAMAQILAHVKVAWPASRWLDSGRRRIRPAPQ